MNYTITKLDRRHSYHASYAYMIEFNRYSNWQQTKKSGVLDYDRSRRWFNEKFGWSQDVETQLDIVKALSAGHLPCFDQPTDYNPVWAYSIKYNEYRIYIKDEATLNWFVLSHSQSTV